MPDTIVTEDVHLVSGYMARPIENGSYPSIIILQEWWGLDEHIRDVTRRFAREGYLALAPDLYHGSITDDPEQARSMSTGLDRSRATRDVISGIDHLLNHDMSNGKIYTIGYCMGGGISILERVTGKLMEPLFTTVAYQIQKTNWTICNPQSLAFLAAMRQTEQQA